MRTPGAPGSPQGLYGGNSDDRPSGASGAGYVGAAGAAAAGYGGGGGGGSVMHAAMGMQRGGGWGGPSAPRVGALPQSQHPTLPTVRTTALSSPPPCSFLRPLCRWHIATGDGGGEHWLVVGWASGSGTFAVGTPHTVAVGCMETEEPG